MRKPLEKSFFMDMEISELVRSLQDERSQSPLLEEKKGALYATLILTLSKSIDKHSNESKVLSNRILWLNIILGIFTIIGTILAVYTFFQGP